MKKDAVEVLSSYVDSLFPIIYINCFDFPMVDRDLALVAGKQARVVEFNNALGLIDFQNKHVIKSCDLW